MIVATAGLVKNHAVECVFDVKGGIKIDHGVHLPSERATAEDRAIHLEERLGSCLRRSTAGVADRMTIKIPPEQFALATLRGAPSKTRPEFSRDPIIRNFFAPAMPPIYAGRNNFVKRIT
jgi:hypothetical protein